MKCDECEWQAKLKKQKVKFYILVNQWIGTVYIESTLKFDALMSNPLVSTDSSEVHS